KKMCDIPFAKKRKSILNRLRSTFKDNVCVDQVNHLMLTCFKKSDLHYEDDAVCKFWGDLELDRIERLMKFLIEFCSTDSSFSKWFTLTSCRDHIFPPKLISSHSDFP